MIWTHKMPSVPGWYAWRRNGEVYPYLTRIYRDDEGLRADMQYRSWEHDHALQDIAEREWYGPLPD